MAISEYDGTAPDFDAYGSNFKAHGTDALLKIAPPVPSQTQD